MMGVWGRQWHQLDHMQAIGTSPRTDSHTNTSSLNFYRPDAVTDAQPTVSKHCRLPPSRFRIWTADTYAHGQVLPPNCTHQVQVSLGHTSPLHKQYLDQFSHFCTVHSHDQQTQTDHTACVAIVHIICCA